MEKLQLTIWILFSLFIIATIIWLIVRKMPTYNIFSPQQLALEELAAKMAIENQKTINQVYEIISQLEVVQGFPIEIKEGPTSCQYTNENQSKVIIITIADGADCTNLYYWIEELLRKAKRQHAIEQSKFSHEKFNQLKK